MAPNCCYHFDIVFDPIKSIPVQINARGSIAKVCNLPFLAADERVSATEIQLGVVCKEFSS
jgi:hypothetical protein